MTHEEAEKICEEFAAKLGEHFDAVQILATWCEEGGTRIVKRGTGNWYARQGLCHQFINSDIADDAAFRLAQTLRDDEGED